MNSAEVIRTLYREMKEWRASGEGPEISWTCRGIEIALNKVRAIAKVEKFRNADMRPRLSRWLASDLAHAVHMAVNYLNKGERSRAMRYLQAAEERIAEGKR